MALGSRFTSSPMTTLEGLDALQKVSASIAALTAAYVGYHGLKAWRIQLHGKTEYDLARRLLRAVFRVRDQIAFVRNPFVPVGEVLEAYKAAGVDTTDLDLSRDDRRRDELVYQQRMLPLASALSDLSVEILEGEVLWGPSVRTYETQLRQVVGELSGSLHLYIRDTHTKHRDEEKAMARLERTSAVVFGTGDADDAFYQKVVAIVAGFEALLVPHLRSRASSRPAAA
jgi:hypothetical protein